jgi:hypothetical protein
MPDNTTCFGTLCVPYEANPKQRKHHREDTPDGRDLDFFLFLLYVISIRTNKAHMTAGSDARSGQRSNRPQVPSRLNQTWQSKKPIYLRKLPD